MKALSKCIILTSNAAKIPRVHDHRCHGGNNGPYGQFPTTLTITPERTLTEKQRCIVRCPQNRAPMCVTERNGTNDARLSRPANASGCLSEISRTVLRNQRPKRRSGKNGGIISRARRLCSPSRRGVVSLRQLRRPLKDSPCEDVTLTLSSFSRK